MVIRGGQIGILSTNTGFERGFGLYAKIVSDYLGMKQPQYSRYENGYRDLPTDVLIALAKLYNTSTDYILGLTNKK